MPATFTAKHLVSADVILDEPLITVEDGTITAISSRHASESTRITHDFKDATLTLGLLDIHMHGAIGHDVMEATPAALGAISTFLARHGVTDYLATTVTASMEFTLRALDGIARLIERKPADGEAAVRGIHIEGPFVSHVKRGMHPPEFIVPPSVAVLEKLWEAARGRILVMTIAPELPGALETIQRAVELGIRCSIGHSNANRTEALRGLAAGAVSATHTYNAMRPLDHREPGILGVVLDSQELYADLICDGVHVAPELVRLWFKCKGPDRAILITDSLQATGMPEGIYKLGETTVHVEGARCTTDAGVLAGSVLTLEQAVARMQEFTQTGLATAVRLASRNPARMLGVAHDLVPGSSANFNVFDSNGTLRHTVLRGRLIS